MQDQSEQSLRILGLAPGASEQTIREAYRDLVKVWHPDRFGADARLREKAQEKLKEINAAFEYLQSARRSRPAPSADTSGRDRSRADRGGAPTWTADSVATRDALRAYGRLTTKVLLGVATGAAIGWLIVSARHPSADAPATPTMIPTAMPSAPAPREIAAAPAAAKPHPAPSDPSPSRTTTEPRPSSPALPDSRVADPRSAAPTVPQEAPPAAPTTGSLSVESQPTGARIYFDGHAIGSTPLRVTEIAPGEHQIRLSLEKSATRAGYKPWTASVVIAAGDAQQLMAIMTPTTDKR